MMAVMLPAFFLGMYEKNGQPMEKLLSYYVQSRFVRPKIRPYKTNNYYAILMKGGATYDLSLIHIWCCRCLMNLPQKSPAPSPRQSMTAKITLLHGR